MIQDGRDTYGALPSPLFATTLERSTYRLFAGGPPTVAGIRDRDRSWPGADPPDIAQEYGPDTLAHAINLLVIAYESTLAPRYLDRAQALGRIAIDHDTTADSELPKAFNPINRYEALTGGG